MKKVDLKDGRVLLVAEADPADSAEILQFVNIAVNESDNLSIGEEGLSQSVVQHAEFLHMQHLRPGAVALCGKVDGRVVGMAGLIVPWQPRVAHTGELSLLVGRSCWGVGVGSALLDILLQHARREGALSLIHLGVVEENRAAISLYKKYGFVQTGVLPGYLRINGESHNKLTMCLRPAEDAPPV